MILVKKQGAFYPYTEKDIDESRNIPEGLPVDCSIKTVDNFRSIAQLRLYWKACAVTAENSDRQEYKTKDHVDFRLRVALQFCDDRYTIVRPNGDVIFKWRSIAMINLKHIEACDYFNQAFELMAQAFDTDKDTFLKWVKEA